MLLYARRARFLLLSVLLAFVAFAPGWAEADNDRKPRIVIFGTSLSDPGNAYQLTKTNVHAPSYGMDQQTDPFDLRIPEFAYARGGNHFSNGATWIEQLAARLGATPNALPAFGGSSAGSANYAVAGSRARSSVVNDVTLSMQVQAYLQDYGDQIPGDTVFVIEMGGNDIRDAIDRAIGVLRTGGTGEQAGAAGSQVIAQAIGDIMGQIGYLWSKGARHFFVWGGPDLSLTPAINRLDQIAPGVGFLAGGLSMGFDLNLKAALGSLPAGSVTVFNVFGLLHEIIDNPDGFGLSNVYETCIQPNQRPSQCSAPWEFLFWDGIHPTQAAHAILARAAATALGAAGDE